MSIAFPLFQRSLAVLALTAVVGACASSVPATAPTTPSTAPTQVTTPSPAPVTSAPVPPADSPTPSAIVPPDRPDLAAVRVKLEAVASGLQAPIWAMAAGDGSGRLFIAEQGGRIRVLQDGNLNAAPFIDLSDRVGAGGERGLLGLAFAPGFGGTEARFYVHYSNGSGDTTISELRANPGWGTADPATERILLVQPQPYANHNGGWIGFDRDGMLLVALGDGGSGGDPQNRASNLNTLLGKMLRLDVLAGPSGDLAYGIPADNPFVERSDARPEILHSGLRNPFRASVDPATGTLWIGDVGQNKWEEIDAAPAGARGLDFGWRRWEGRHCFDPAQGCDPDGVTQPMAEYGHGKGCSVTGGVVYRGSAIPALRGAYLFSDYCSGTLWAIDAGLDAQQTPFTLLETGRSISSIGTDEAGEIVVTDLGGGHVLRLVPAG